MKIYVEIVNMYQSRIVSAIKTRVLSDWGQYPR